MRDKSGICSWEVCLDNGTKLCTKFMNFFHSLYGLLEGAVIIYDEISLPLASRSAPHRTVAPLQHIRTLPQQIEL